MDGLIFFAVIIFFSIIESISRSRKAQQKREGEAPAEPELFEWAQTPQSEADLPTYDDDRSYDDSEEEHYDAREAAASGRPAPAQEKAGLTGAEVAQDILAELTALAARSVDQSSARTRQIPPTRSRAPRPDIVRTPRPAPVPRSLPQPSAHEVQEEGRALPSEGRGLPRPHQEHRAHRAHEEYGTDPSERKASEQDGLDPLARHLGADAAAVRARLMSQDESALRQAVILQEVLGPPAALQRDRFEE